MSCKSQDPEARLLSFFGWWLRRRSDFSFSLFPSARQFSRAVADLVYELRWRKFAVVYEDEEALASRLTGVLGLQGKKEVKPEAAAAAGRRRKEAGGGDGDEEEKDEGRQTRIASFRLPDAEKAERSVRLSVPLCLSDCLRRCIAPLLQLFFFCVGDESFCGVRRSLFLQYDF